MKYDNLLNGTQLIESSLHAHLIEHLNAEIVLGTIADVSVAIEWLRSTFLYIRVMKNPKHYGEFIFHHFQNSHLAVQYTAITLVRNFEHYIWLTIP